MRNTNLRTLAAALFVAAGSLTGVAHAAPFAPTATESQTNATWVNPSETAGPSANGVAIGINPTATRAEANATWVNPQDHVAIAPATVGSSVSPTAPDGEADETWVNPFAG